MDAWLFLTRIWRLQRRLFEEARPCMEAAGIKPKGLFLLAHIQKGAYPKELAESFHMPPPTVSHLIGALEDAGYLVRESDPKDRRRYLLKITEEGEAALETARKCLEGVVRGWLESLRPEEAQTLLGLLERLDGDRS